MPTYVRSGGQWLPVSGSNSLNPDINNIASANQVLYKNSSNIATGSSNLTFNGTNLSCGGNITASGTVTANSDIKLKTNVKTIPNALDKVTRLRGVEYDRIDYDNHEIGVIAQEVEEVIPEVVTDNSGTKAVAYGNLVGLLIEAIKEQQNEINILKQEINELKKL
jgi:hypothetical protein